MWKIIFIDKLWEKLFSIYEKKKFNRLHYVLGWVEMKELNGRLEMPPNEKRNIDLNNESLEYIICFNFLFYSVSKRYSGPTICRKVAWFDKQFE